MSSLLTKLPIYYEPIVKHDFLSYKEVTNEDKRHLLEILSKEVSKSKGKDVHFNEKLFEDFTFLYYNYENHRILDFGMNRDKYRVDLDNETVEITQYSCF